MIEPGRSCLVLGGGGFIGTNLCRRLVARGLRVRGFGRRALFPAELAKVVRGIAGPGDLVVCLGAGNITQWAYALPDELKALG